MKDNMKKIIGLIIIAALVFSLSFACFVLPQREYSESERRNLMTLPELSLQTVLSGRFMSSFEDYTLDQFPFRDGFRRIKATVSKYVFLRPDNNDVFVTKDGYIGKIEYPIKEKSISFAGRKFGEIYEKYLSGKTDRIYLSVIPDKNAFIAEQNGYPSIDYDAFYDKMKAAVPFAEYIDIAPLLSRDDYYKTDTHWRQERIVDVAEKLAESMGTKIGGRYTENLLEKDFYGVYHGQAALDIPPDDLKYLTSEIIEKMRVYDHQNGKEISVYDMEKGMGRDPYEIFLSGPLSLLEIDNPSGEEGKELLIFRDSFASSILPLLAEGYSKVWVADIRYMSPAMLENYLSFEDKDVLFLYSALVLNNSSTFK